MPRSVLKYFATWYGSAKEQDRNRIAASGQQFRIVEDPDAVRVEGSVVAVAGQVAVNAQVLILRFRLMVHDIGFPVQIDIRHFEIVERTEILLHPQPDLEDNGPADDKERRLSEEAKASHH
jgi:hypothetical protein